MNIEHVEVDFDAQVGRLGDLVVRLISPNGTQSLLLDRAGKVPLATPGASDADVGSTQEGAFKYTFMSAHARGEDLAGDWTLQVTNTANGLPVTLNNWSLRLFGADATGHDSYFYTDEFADSVKRQAERAVLNDGSGRNTINAAAVSGDVSVDLSTGAAVIGGVALTVNNAQAIHNLLSGDGNDTLVAGPSDSLLNGGRGNNTLVGGAGKDVFVVHRRGGGLDTLVNFDPARAEVINLVGFKGKKFDDLRLTQQETDVQVALGDGQDLLLKNQLIASIGASQFKFQTTFVAPVVPTETPAIDPPPVTPEIAQDLPGTVTLNGGATGTSLSSDATGRFVASLSGKVYSHDSEAANVFVVAKQESVSDYKNALRGFRQGADKIDLSQTGITDFSALTISKLNRATINDLSLVHGVEISISAADPASTIKLLYLDALEVSQLSASDFIFARPEALPNVIPMAERLPVAEYLLGTPSGDFSSEGISKGEQAGGSAAFAQHYQADALVQAMAMFAPQDAAALTFMPMEPRSVHPVLVASAA
ncbi:proprotein convertase P-domain-containing protein [Pseudomonas silesiensis]|uniref:proprotein convertase P-domain-containing protein n=1 Tax=Pseudomonas silesiensis TaxID=1853130 RepID=UPI0034D72011